MYIERGCPQRYPIIYKISNNPVKHLLQPLPFYIPKLSEWPINTASTYSIEKYIYNVRGKLNLSSSFKVQLSSLEHQSPFHYLTLTLSRQLQ